MKLPDRGELEADVERLEEALRAATGRGDEEAVDELTLQIRVKQHWLRKCRDDHWKDYYRDTKRKELDGWGKTGAR